MLLFKQEMFVKSCIMVTLAKSASQSGGHTIVKNNIQIVFLDIDGTLYYDGKLIPSAKKAVDALMKKNLLVALCTGRSVIHTRKVQDELQVHLGIYFNGSLARHGDKKIHTTPLKDETVSSVIHLLEEKGIPIILHTERDIVSFSPIPINLYPILRKFDFPPIRVVSKDSFSNNTEPVYQINAFMTNSLEPELEEKFPECLIYRWDTRAVDLQRRQSDKSIGAKSLLEYFKISPENALHIGDGGNDIGMFKTMGYSVAMGNATNKVQAFAKIVAPPAYDDGVYSVLQKLELID